MACQADAHIQRVMERAENVTRVPQANSEFVQVPQHLHNPLAVRGGGPVLRLYLLWHYLLQVLQYEVGQYYGGHHDFIPAHSRLPCGPRVYTLFMYLSEVEEGGETELQNPKPNPKPQPKPNPTPNPKPNQARRSSRGWASKPGPKKDARFCGLRPSTRARSSRTTAPSTRPSPSSEAPSTRPTCGCTSSTSRRHTAWAAVAERALRLVSACW